MSAEVDRTSAAPGTGGARTPPDEAFAELYETWRPALVNICRHRLGRHADAEAVAQEAFLRAWRSWDRFTVDRPFWPWLATIARNLCTTETSHRRRHETPVDVVPDVASPRDEVDEVAGRHMIIDVLQTLSPRYRRLIGLRDLEGWSYEEMAHFEGVTVDAIRGSLKRARAHFRQVYERTARTFGVAVVSMLHRLREQAASPLPWRALFGPEASAVLAALCLIGPGSHATAVDVPAVPAEVVATAAPSAWSTSSVPATTTATIAAASGARSVASAISTSPAGLDVEVMGVTASPGYERDSTVYLWGRATDCTLGSSTMCVVLYRSTDAGVTWERLPAQGRSEGAIVLPPAYPADPRVFSVSAHNVPGGVLEVSYDGGRTFSVLTPITGPVAFSPLFSAGDPRILIGSNLVPPFVQPGVEFVEGSGIRPLSLGLPVGANPTGFAFSPGFKTDRRVLVGVAEADVVTGSTSALYECVGTAPCRRLARFGFGQPRPLFVDNDTVLVWQTFSLFRSDDGGDTFREVTRPGASSYRTIFDLRLVRPGRLVASMVEGGDEGGAWMSDDAGTTWRHIGADVLDRSANVVATLSDGRMIGGQYGMQGLVCSGDDGRSWAPCGVPA